MDNEEFNENNNKKTFADRLNTAANLYNGYQNYKNNKKDVDAINNRAKNESTNNNIKNEEQNEENNSNKRNSSLEEKEGLEKNSQSLDKKEELTKKDQNTEQKNNKSSKNNNSKKESNDLDLFNGKNIFKSLSLKTKIILMLVGIGIAIFLLLLFFIIIAGIIDTFTSAISTFFGISEGDIVKDGIEYEYSGLYTDENYYYDEDGNVLSDEDLVNKLNEDNDCKITIWNTITDWLPGWSGGTCEVVRYIERHTAGKNVDKALIIGTIFYGYDAQPNKNDYVDKNDYNDDIPATDHFDALNDVLKNNNFLTTDDLNDLISQSEINSDYSYYSWEIDSSEEGKLIGKCKANPIENSEFSLLRWELFMRFGSDVSDAYAKDIESNEKTYLFDEECNGSLSNEELLNKVKSSASSSDIECSIDENSINEAKQAYSNSSNVNLDKYNQAANPDSRTKDVFQNIDSLVLDYRNGFAYNHFPYYASMKSDYTGDKTNLKYDEVFTPKEIETIIQEIIDRKSDLNSVLLLDDKTEDNLSYQDNISSVITGAYCNNYLKAKLDDITVRLTDCNGLFMANVPFSEYIVGVANGEVSNRNDNYLLSEMVAAISFALNRRGNYSKGTVIDMRSGNCDQVYCSIKLGCTPRSDPQVCNLCTSYLIGGERGKGTEESRAKYMALYEKASDYLLVKDGKIFGAHYNSNVQNEWYDKSSKGMSFTQIIQETYQDEGAELIRCSEIDDNSNSDSSESPIVTSGSLATDEYPKVSPNVGKYSGFSYKNGSEEKEVEINPEWKSSNLVDISSNCNEAGWNKTYTVNVNAKSNFEEAFSNVCNILKNGVTLSNGKTCKYTVDDLKNGSTFIERTQSDGNFNLHAYGLAQDWNYDRTYTIKGNQYKPYGSNRDIEEYQRFVDAIGGEENCENINYILYKYAYEDAGFIWGGTWSGKTFDGMHFEIN